MFKMMLSVSLSQLARLADERSLARRFNERGFKDGGRPVVSVEEKVAMDSESDRRRTVAQSPAES